MGRKDQLPAGWKRVAICLPTGIAREFVDASRFQGDLKRLATLAMALLAQMPEPVRQEMTTWLTLQERSGPPGDMTSELILNRYESVMRAHGHWPAVAHSASPPLLNGPHDDADEQCPRTVLRNPIRRRAAG